MSMDFPGGSDGKASVYNVRDLGLIPGLGRFPGEGNGNPLQYSCFENPMDGGAWCRLLSMVSQRVGHDWVTSLSLNVYRFFFSILNINLYIQLSLHEKVLVHSVRVSLHSHGLVRLLCPWNSPGKNIGVDSHSLLQGIFPTQVLNPSFPHCRQIFYLLSHQGSPHENLV